MKQRAVVKCEASEGHSTAELDARCLLFILSFIFLKYAHSTYPRKSFKSVELREGRWECAQIWRLTVCDLL